jgi:hypothetical protein
MAAPWRRPVSKLTLKQIERICTELCNKRMVDDPKPKYLICSKTPSQKLKKYRSRKQNYIRIRFFREEPII